MLFSLENDDVLKNYFNLDRDDVLNPDEGLVLGNLFLDEYVPYKNYKPYKIKPTCDKDAMLLKIREYCFAIDDLNLKLDLEPNNKKLYDLFKVYNERLKVLVKDYEEKYEVLDLNDDLKGRYTWYSGKWPWEGDYRNV